MEWLQSKITLYHINQCCEQWKTNQCYTPQVQRRNDVLTNIHHLECKPRAKSVKIQIKMIENEDNNVWDGNWPRLNWIISEWAPMRAQNFFLNFCRSIFSMVWSKVRQSAFKSFKNIDSILHSATKKPMAQKNIATIKYHVPYSNRTTP